MKGFHNLGCKALATTALVWVIGGAARAQEAPPPPAPAANNVAGTATGQDGNASEADSLGDVVVTARRRAESLMSVPVAVTALDGAALRQANLTQLADIARVAPAVRVSNVAGRLDSLAVAIRGQIDTGGQITTDPAVGVYFADAIQTRPQALGRSLYDIASIQVLKGPQGTLFGRNLTGGAVLIAPVAAKLGVVEGYVQGIYGNYNRRELQGALNLPIGDMLAVRIAGNVTARDGYTLNLTTGNRGRDDSGEAFRVSVQFEPRDGLRNTTIFDYAAGRGHGGAVVPFAVNPAVDTAANPYAARLAAFNRAKARSVYINEDDSDSPQSSSNRGITNTTEIGLGGATFKNIFNYRRVTSSAYVADGVPQNLVLVGNIVDSHQVSNETQILGKTLNDRLDYIVGAYYFRENGVQTGYVPVLGGPARTNIGDATNISKSLFAQFDFAITDRLKLTAGGRYTWDDRRLYQQVRSSPTGPNTLDATVQKSFGKPTWTLSLNYQPSSDTLVYLTNRRGYRSGGFNSGATVAAALAPVESEVLTDYELGFKSQGRLGGMGYRVTLAAYHANYDNIQKNLVALVGTPPAPARILLNAARATINGGELEAAIVPVPWFELSGFVGLTDAKYDSFVDPSNGADLSSIGFAQVPKWTRSLSGVLTVPIPERIGRLRLSASYYWQGKLNLTDGAPFPGSAAVPYDTVSARLSLENIAGSKLRTALFVTNLTNTVYAQSVTPFYAAPYGVSSQIYSDPRFYGVEVGFSF